MSRWDASRREFIRAATIAAGAFAAGCVPPDAVVPVEPVDPEPPTPPPGPCVDEPLPEWLTPSEPRVGLPHLGGAPDTNTGWAVAAFCDTVVPGAWRDPTGAPGGIDVGAPGMFFDPELPAAEFVGVLAAFLDLVANQVEEGETFATLSPAARDEALEGAIEALDLTELAIQLAKLAFFASESGACHMGYPGANIGYIDDPDFSFGVALTEEITEDGNFG